MTATATETAYERLVCAIEQRGGSVRSRGAQQAHAQCPAHEDREPSLSITGIEGQTLVHCHAGCETVDVLAALDLGLADLYDSRRGAEYRYDGGRTVIRTVDKRFRQTGTGNRPELYRLAKVRAAVAEGRPVYVCEGEKDVHALEALGVTATCSPMGAGKWSKVDPSPLFGGRVLVIADQDEPGRRHAAEVVRSLSECCEVAALAPKTGKDAADHIAAGYGVQDLVPVQLRDCSALPDTRGAERGAPLYADVSALLNGGLPDPPAPKLLTRTDGVSMFYAAQTNYIFGDPESGKTWVAIAAVVEALGDGRRALIVDLDHNGVTAIVARLLDLGADPEVLGDPARFRYAEPEDTEHLDAIVSDSRTWRPAVAVVDSIGELLPLLRLSSNSPDDFTVAHARALKPFAQAGAAVLCIDHLAKNPDSRTQGASGTAAKRRAIGGTSLRVTVKDVFAPGVGGSCYLNVFKDRHGGLRAHCPPGIREPAAGIFELSPTGDTLRWRIGTPEAGDSFIAAGVRDEDIAELDGLDPPPKSQRDVQTRLQWGGSRALGALQAWRSLRNAPQERGSSAPRSATQGVRSAEHSAEIVQLRPGPRGDGSAS